MKILKNSDLVKITTNTETPFSVYISPLTIAAKIEVAGKVKMIKGVEVADNQAQAFLCVKYCVKKIEGVETYDGEAYELTMQDGVMADECVDDVLSLLASEQLVYPMVMAANKTISGLKDVTVEVNPKS